MNNFVCAAVLLSQLFAAILLAEPPDAPRLTASQQERLTQAEKLNSQINALFGERKVREAIVLAKQVLAINKEVLGEKHPSTANSLTNLGSLLQIFRDYAAARPYLEQALAINKEVLGEKHPDTASSLDSLGALLQMMGDYAAARPYLEQALAINREVLGEKHPELANSLDQLGYVLQIIGDYPAARLHHEQALAIRKEVFGEKHPDTAKSLSTLGALSQAVDDYGEARRYDQQALTIRKEVLGPKHPDTIASLDKLGMLLKETQEFRAARIHLEEALAIRKEVLGEKHPDTAKSLNNLGSILDDMGDYAAARPYYVQALAIRKEVLGEKHPDTATSLDNLGGLLTDMGDYAAARSYLEQALAIRKEVLGEKHADTAKSFNNLGLLLQSMGDDSAASSYLEQALALSKEVLGEKHRTTATALSNIGTLLNAMGDTAAARPYLEQALAIRKEVLGEKHLDTAASLDILGALLQAIGDYGTARPLYEQALAIHKEVLGDNRRDTAVSVNNLGLLFHAMGDHAAAHPYYERSLAICKEVLGEKHPDTAKSLENLSGLQAALGEWRQAAATENDARSVVRRHVSRVLPGLSQREQLVFLQNKDEASWHASLSLGLERRDDRQIADLSAGWLINGKAVAQEALAAGALLARENRDPKLADTVQELIEARRQLAVLSLSSPKPGQGAVRKEQLAKLEAQEEGLSRQLARAGSHAVQAEPWIELASVRKQIPDGGVLVDMARFKPFNFQAKGKVEQFGAAHYVAWVIAPVNDAGVQVVDLGEAEPIDQAVRTVRQSLQDAAKPKGPIAQQGEPEAEKALTVAMQQLSQLVLQPIIKEIGDAKQLILSPDASLWLVPWGALPLADGRYSIEEYQIRYVVSGRDLVTRVASKQRTSTPLVMADPNFDLGPAQTQAATRAVLRGIKLSDNGGLRTVSTEGSSLPKVARLPATAVEAQVITPKLASYAKGQPTVYTDQYALEGVFKAAQRPKVLVLSTHGFFLPDQEAKADESRMLASTATRGAALTVEGKPLENPLLRCGLLLAGCNQKVQAASGEDGVLTGMEIVDTDLRGTELVVLSACETGLGQVRNGEGVAGLRQAFQLAGAKSVVATLWQIPDRESARLMSDFFTNLAGGQSMAEALRSAQLAMIKFRRDKYAAAHPFYWAAFTITGGE